MEIASVHASILGDRAFRRAVDECKGTRGIRALGVADMNLVGIEGLLGLGMNGFDAREALLLRHHRRDVEKPESLRLASRPLDAFRIGDAASQHLIAAADAEHMPAAAMMRRYVDVPALRAQESKVAAGRFRAGKDDERGISGDRFAGSRP